MNYKSKYFLRSNIFKFQHRHLVDADLAPVPSPLAPSSGKIHETTEENDSCPIYCLRLTTQLYGLTLPPALSLPSVIFNANVHKKQSWSCLDKCMMEMFKKIINTYKKLSYRC